MVLPGIIMIVDRGSNVIVRTASTSRQLEQQQEIRGSSEVELLVATDPFKKNNCCSSASLASLAYVSFLGVWEFF